MSINPRKRTLRADSSFAPGRFLSEPVVPKLLHLLRNDASRPDLVEMGSSVRAPILATLYRQLSGSITNSETLRHYETLWDTLKALGVTDFPPGDDSEEFLLNKEKTCTLCDKHYREIDNFPGKCLVLHKVVTTTGDVFLARIDQIYGDWTTSCTQEQQEGLRNVDPKQILQYCYFCCSPKPTGVNDGAWVVTHSRHTTQAVAEDLRSTLKLHLSGPE